MKRLFSLSTVAASIFALMAVFPAFGQAPPAFQPPTDLSAPGTLAVTINQYGTGTIEIQATGTATGLAFATQCLPTSGVNWVTLPMVVPSTGASATSQSANGDWLVSTSAFSQCRVNLTAITGTEKFSISNGIPINPLATPGSAIAGSATAANQALQLTQETTTATGTGAPADTAWSGSGNSTIIAALKGVYGKVAAALAVTQSGTWTVQPGNTANTTPWLHTNIPSAAAAAGTAAVSSSALAANTVIKASPGNLYSFEVSADSTLSAAAWWIMIYNATAAPGDGAVTPAKCYAMPAGATGFTGALPNPLSFATGIVIGVSTTGCFTKTASTHAFISGDAQ